MLSNLIQQFSCWFKHGKQEVIETRTFIEPNSNVMNENSKVNESSDSGLCSQPSFSNAICQQSSKQQQKQSNRKTIQCHEHERCCNKQNCNKSSETSIFKVFLLFVTLFVLIFTIAISLFIYINQSIQQRDALASEFVTRSDIDEIIQNLLKEIEHSDSAPDKNDQIRKKRSQSIDVNELR